MSKINKIRRSLLPKLHPLDGSIGRLIPPKGKPRDLIRERGDEYVCSVNCPYDELVQLLKDGGYQVNFLSTLKYVELDNGRSWEVGSMAYRRPIGARFMHHAYWMPAAEENTTFHIGHHKERNYLDIPTGITEHTDRSGEFYESGDPDNILQDALGDRKIYMSGEPTYQRNGNYK